MFPKLLNSGAGTSGDTWKVGLITASVGPGGVLTCDVKPSPSQQPHAATDGSNAYCVDNTATDTSDSAILFTPGGAVPLDADALCFH